VFVDSRTLAEEALRSEEEIMKSWLDADVLVSIVCITYNHEHYIADAIKGFLLQETSFPFEIVIHDDASTDATAGIIRRFAASYPTLIRPIYSPINKYSENPHRPFADGVKASVGAYLAFCEGDDYWCDPQKLKVQVDAMGSDENVLLCFHPAHSMMGDHLERICSDECYDIKLISARSIIADGGGACPSASSMFKRAALENLPDWFQDVPVGDYYLQSLAASIAGAIRISEPMSVYRKSAEGSFTARLDRKSSNERVDHAFARIESNDHLAEEIDSKFKRAVDMCSSRYIVDIGLEVLGERQVLLFLKCVARSIEVSLVIFPFVFLEAMGIRVRRIIARRFHSNNQSTMDSK